MRTTMKITKETEIKKAAIKYATATEKDLMYGFSMWVSMFGEKEINSWPLSDQIESFCNFICGE